MKHIDVFLNKCIAAVYLLLSLPLWPLFFLLIKTTSKGPLLFTQKRAGRDMKIFTIYKFRTMVDNAEHLQKKYRSSQNGPLFKLQNDPRYTRIGKLLARTSLDEIPQFINVLRGEMALVGPRPFPVDEAKKIPPRYKKRFSVLPGITSTGVIEGNHKLGFAKWMEKDLEYVKSKSVKKDMYLFFLTHIYVVKLFYFHFLKKNK